MQGLGSGGLEVNLWKPLGVIYNEGTKALQKGQKVTYSKAGYLDPPHKLTVKGSLLWWFLLYQS